MFMTNNIKNALFAPVALRGIFYLQEDYRITVLGGFLLVYIWDKQRSAGDGLSSLHVIYEIDSMFAVYIYLLRNLNLKIQCTAKY